VFSRCSKCMIEDQREWRDSLSDMEKEEINSVRRAKYARNPEPYIKQASSYYEHNKDLANKRNKERRIKNKEINLNLTHDEIINRTPVKFCNSCNKELPSSKFYIAIHALNGLSTYCKICHKECKNIIREINIKCKYCDILIKSGRVCISCKKEKERLRKKKYYQENKEKLNMNHKEYWKENKERFNKDKREHYHGSTLGSIYKGTNK